MTNTPIVLLTVFGPLLFCLALLLFAIYFMVTALQFFRHKTEADKELLQKLDELIKLQKTN